MTHALARRHGLQGAKANGSLALTELYDLIDLKLPAGAKPQILQEQFCEQMQDWQPACHHRAIMGWAVANQSPVLTTNFDEVLAKAAVAKLYTMFQPRGSLKGPTDYYPWEKYFGISELADPCDGFGIWHINGLVHHIRSIRLGLTHYMGAVSRARPWIHGGKETRLFTQKNMRDWRGRDTWLHIIFNMPLLILGLRLGTEEVFLRWLLIERAKYFRLFPDRRLPAWYVYPSAEDADEDRAKRFFLSSLGIAPVEVGNYGDIYSLSEWS